MADVLVLGAGLTGLTAGMVLARDGHDVTVLEHDPAPPPPEAEASWTDWERGGVTQFHQLHFLLPRWRAVMEEELPAVLGKLVGLGGLRMNSLHLRPESSTGGSWPGDDRFDMVTARRPVIESAVSAVATRTPGLRVRRGVAVTGLLTSARSAGSRIPHVSGVRTAAGEDLRADLVVDAGGRRSAVSKWLAAAGGPPPRDERADGGFIYYGRHYRARDGRMPEGVDGPLTHYDSVSVLTLPADNGTYGLGLITSARDKDLRALRHAETWEAAVRGYPVAAHWIDAEPITDIQVMAGIEDRRRHYVVDGEPVVTGLVAIGDASACTNPSLGRGASIGAMHACALRDVVAKEGTDDPDTLVRRFDEVSQATITPHVESTLSFDRHRLAEIEADIAGKPYETDDQAWAVTAALRAGAQQDPELTRALSTIAAVLATPMEVLADPELLQRVLSHRDSPRYPDGATRAELLAAVCA